MPESYRLIDDHANKGEDADHVENELEIWCRYRLWLRCALLILLNCEEGTKPLVLLSCSVVIMDRVTPFHSALLWYCLSRFCSELESPIIKQRAPTGDGLFAA